MGRGGCPAQQRERAAGQKPAGTSWRVAEPTEPADAAQRQPSCRHGGVRLFEPFCFNLCYRPGLQIAVQLAVVFAKVARFDYPKSWPGLLGDLLGRLQVGGAECCRAAGMLAGLGIGWVVYCRAGLNWRVWRAGCMAHHRGLLVLSRASHTHISPPSRPAAGRQHAGGAARVPSAAPHFEGAGLQAAAGRPEEL